MVAGGAVGVAVAAGMSDPVGDGPVDGDGVDAAPHAIRRTAMTATSAAMGRGLPARGAPGWDVVASGTSLSRTVGDGAPGRADGREVLREGIHACLPLSHEGVSGCTVGRRPDFRPEGTVTVAGLCRIRTGFATTRWVWMTGAA